MTDAVRRLSSRSVAHPIRAVLVAAAGAVVGGAALAGLGVAGAAGAAAAGRPVDLAGGARAVVARPATGSSAEGRELPATVPLAALGVAVAGSLGALALTRRHERRATAMARHPAYRGVGRRPPLERR